ncbi:hypothetical protein C2G38_2047831 [Gigaspora rosea]|uniref:BED-type domain-containing protein n=1 Tax=Gigaspora rosea TaxID=44941 RepID=A0A397U8S7_9GLOM|nr:hypothetical protein C2G38_2047831 [Gigaspora rosea]
MRNTHEICNYFHINTLKTRLICNICEAFYNIDTCLNNLKKHFFKHHKQEYHLAMSKNEEQRKQIKEINQVQRKENPNNLITQNNETSLVQVSNHVQVEDINEDNYMTKEEIEEVVIETNQVLPLVQSNKRKGNDNKEVVKKQKISSISLNAKESIIDLNIQDEISLRIEGECTLNFN